MYGRLLHFELPTRLPGMYIWSFIYYYIIHVCTTCTFLEEQCQKGLIYNLFVAEVRKKYSVCACMYMYIYISISHHHHRAGLFIRSQAFSAGVSGGCHGIFGASREGNLFHFFIYLKQILLKYLQNLFFWGREYWNRDRDFQLELFLD